MVCNSLGGAIKEDLHFHVQFVMILAFFVWTQMRQLFSL